MTSRRWIFPAFLTAAATIAFAAAYVALLANQLGDSVIDLSKASPTSTLKNDGFEEFAPAAQAGEFVFGSWASADFWNNQLAAGLRKPVGGFKSGSALELVLTDAAGGGYHFGVQQACGQFPANTWLTISADVNVPEAINGSQAAVGLILYPPSTDMPHVSANVARSDATGGWQRLTASVRAPTEAQIYSCIVIIHLVARQPLAHVHHVADFDNVVLSTIQ